MPVHFTRCSALMHRNSCKDVSELSLPGRQCWFCRRRPSSFYFVKTTKTAARTSRAIYTTCCRIRLKAKSCLEQEMRRVSLSFLWRFLHFLPLPFLCQDSVTRYSRSARCYQELSLCLKRRSRDESCIMNNLNSASFKFLLFGFYVVRISCCRRDCKCTFTDRAV